MFRHAVTHTEQRGIDNYPRNFVGPVTGYREHFEVKCWKIEEEVGWLVPFKYLGAVHDDYGIKEYDL